MKKIPLLFILILAGGCEKAVVGVTIDNYYYNTNLSKWQGWVYEGDSMTDVKILSKNYPTQLNLLNSSIQNTKQVNVAESGESIQFIIDQYAAQVHPNAPKDTSLKYIFAIMAGTNDAARGRSSRQIYNDLKTEWANAKKDNFTVMAFCITRSTDPARDTVAIAVNKLILADTTPYTYLIRTDQLLPDPANPGFFTDGVHPTTEGSILIAKQIIRTLNSR